MTDDQHLLGQYVSEGSRQALDEIIRRYQNLVYSAALRQVRNQHLAEDVTQAVFLVLAQKARGIRPGSSLGGWLYTVTRRAAIHAMKKQQTQHRHERAAARADQCPDASIESWELISGDIDAAMAELSTADRDAVILRYFQEMPFAEIGAQMGLTDEAARKRVSRALERLRERLGHRGVAVGSVVLAAAISAHAVQSAPAAVMAVGSAGAVGISKGVIQMMALAKMKIAAFVTIAILFLGGAGFALTSRTWAQQNLQANLGGQNSAANAPAAGQAPGVTAVPIATAPGVRVIQYDMKTDTSGPGAGGTPGVMGKNETISHIIESDNGLRCETDETGIRTLTEQHSYERIVYDDRNKFAVVYPGPGANPKEPSKRDIPPTAEKKFMDMIHAQGSQGTSELLDGKPATKYTYSTPQKTIGGMTALATDNTIWCDPASGEIIQVTAVSSGSGKFLIKFTQEFTHFKMNPALPPVTLALDPPADYKLIVPPNFPSLEKHLSKQIARTVADAFKSYLTEADAPFPTDLNAVNTYVKLNKTDIIETGEEDPSLPKLVSSAGPPPKVNSWFAHMNLGIQLAKLPKDSWAYLGAGKPRGNANDLIFWCKEANGYKGIYGDLSVKDLDGPGPSAEAPGN